MECGMPARLRVSCRIYSNKCLACPLPALWLMRTTHLLIRSIGKYGYLFCFLLWEEGGKKIYMDLLFLYVEACDTVCVCVRVVFFLFCFAVCCLGGVKRCYLPLIQKSTFVF